jgi:hypothetical protein
MGGFSSSSEQPSPEEMQRMGRRFSAPDNEAPVAVPVSVVLGRGPDAAVLLTSAGGVLDGNGIHAVDPGTATGTPPHHAFASTHAWDRLR